MSTHSDRIGEQDAVATRVDSTVPSVLDAALPSAALRYESTHVHQVYDAIAAHFSSTRYKPWPLVRQFVEQLPFGSLLADVGCGNGKNLDLGRHNSVFSVGCDYCDPLTRIAAGSTTSRPEVMRADAVAAPWRDGCFDAAISIAVIHHFSTRSRRVAALLELLRIVVPGGVVLVYVWALEQSRKRMRATPNPEGDPCAAADTVSSSATVALSSATTTTTTTTSSAFTSNPSVGDPLQLGNEVGDVLVPWEMHKKFDDSEQVRCRYYHLFGKGELESLCNEDVVASIAVVERSYFDKENWCVVLRKKGQR